MQISKRIQNLPVSATRKLTPYAKVAEAAGVKVYHLNTGDPDIKTPAAILSALTSWDINPIRYAQSAGEPEFIQALLWYYHKIGFGFIKSENILPTVGGSEAIGMAMFGTCQPGDEIIVFEPFYSNYATYAALQNIKLVAVPTSLATGFHLPKKSVIEKYITPKTKAIFYCSPCNPTGTVYSREEIAMLVQIAKKHNLFLISDEVYREFIFTKTKHTSLLEFMREIPEQAIMLDSLSKRYSLCGARLGIFTTLNADLMKGVTKIAQSRLSAGLIEQIAAAKLTKVPASYTKKVQAEYRSRRDFLFKSLQKIPGVKVSLPEGAFYVMVALPVKNAEEFCIWLLEKYRTSKNETLMMAPGAGFYASSNKGLNEVRLAYVLNKKDLKKCLDILAEALKIYLSI